MVLRMLLILLVAAAALHLNLWLQRPGHAAYLTLDVTCLVIVLFAVFVLLRLHGKFGEWTFWGIAIVNVGLLLGYYHMAWHHLNMWGHSATWRF